MSWGDVPICELECTEPNLSVFLPKYSVPKQSDLKIFNAIEGYFSKKVGQGTMQYVSHANIMSRLLCVAFRERPSKKGF